MSARVGPEMVSLCAGPLQSLPTLLQQSAIALVTPFRSLFLVRTPKQSILSLCKMEKKTEEPEPRRLFQSVHRKTKSIEGRWHARPVPLEAAGGWS